MTRFCDRRIDDEAAHARAVFETDPAAAGETWARLDRQLVDRAPWVPLFNFKGAYLVSKRVGNWQYHPYMFALLDQLWVR